MLSQVRDALLNGAAKEVSSLRTRASPSSWKKSSFFAHTQGEIPQVTHQTLPRPKNTAGMCKKCCTRHVRQQHFAHELYGNVANSQSANRANSPTVLGMSACRPCGPSAALRQLPRKIGEGDTWHLTHQRRTHRLSSPGFPHKTHKAPLRCEPQAHWAHRVGPWTVDRPRPALSVTLKTHQQQLTPSSETPSKPKRAQSSKLTKRIVTAWLVTQAVASNQCRNIASHPSGAIEAWNDRVASTSTPGRNSSEFHTSDAVRGSAQSITAAPTGQSSWQESTFVTFGHKLLAIAAGWRISAIPRSPAHHLFVSVLMDDSRKAIECSAPRLAHFSRSAQQACREPWH